MKSTISSFRIDILFLGFVEWCFNPLLFLCYGENIQNFKLSPSSPLLFTINQTTHCLWNLRDWMLLMQGMFTGLLGNLSLLSYFTKKREKEVIVVQTLGVVSQYVVFLQLAMAEAMPLPYFVITLVVVAARLILNFTNYFNLLNAGIWRIWEDFITVGGLSILPQVISSSLSLFLSLFACPNTHTNIYSKIYFGI